MGPLCLRNPLIAASGTFGYGWELSEFLDCEKLGGVVQKTVTLRPRKGNPPPRTCETASGMLNSIGLPNGGLEEYLRVELPFLSNLPTCRIASIAGETADEFAQLAAAIDEQGGADALEVNVSCPNVKEGCLTFGADPSATAEATSAVRGATSLPIIVKLTPNVSDIGEVARAAADAGANILSAVNTFLGLAVDWTCGRPVLGNGTGGLSGPAIKPLALQKVREVVEAVDIPVVGLGGITSGRDALEFLTVGAAAVQAGTASLVEPTALLRILDEMSAELARWGFSSVSAVIGTLEMPG